MVGGIIMKFKKITFIMLAWIFVVIFASCTEGEQSPEAEPNLFIALGDSVSSGYGLPYLEERHTFMFYERLKENGYSYIEHYLNKAVAGYTTTDLLSFLNEMDKETRNIFNMARIVTLNIGGNNILTPFTQYLSGRDDIDIEDIISEYAEVEENDAAIGRRIVDGALAVWGVVRDAVTDAVGTGRTIFGLFTPELEAALEEGVRTFADEFGQIIEWIEVHAPRATIIVNTVYNPIPSQLLIIPVALSDRAEELILLINDIIREESEARGFLVSDIHARFARESNLMSLMRFNLNPFAGGMSVDLIHPNPTGHNIIAQLKYEQYLLSRLARMANSE